MEFLGPRAAVTALGNHRLRAGLDPVAGHDLLVRQVFRVLFRLAAAERGVPPPPLPDLPEPGVELRLAGVRDLDSAYESLLELVPRVGESYELVEVAGHRRRTSGSYYTPAPLVECLLDTVLEPVLDDAVRRGEQTGDVPAALLALKVCDPACGSGRFLVAAAHRIARRLAGARGGDPAAALREVVESCLYGVDLDPMAVELATTTLWLAAPGFRGLHLRQGNALIGFDWRREFPEVFPAGFDCVLGNPPWERVKFQEQEFFAHRDATIAAAGSAARRKQLIAELKEDPARGRLHAEFRAAKERADAESRFLRHSGRFPLTGRGDINTYAVFAEAGRQLLAAGGRMGMIVPTGIATDATTRFFFDDLVTRRSLVALYDFENRGGLFPGVDSRMRFAVLAVAGPDRPEPAARFAFFLRDPAELAEPGRTFTLTSAEIALLNPVTGTCPVFRSRRDAELTLAIYRRLPVLADAWDVSFRRMFDMTNDSHLFRPRSALTGPGLPLYQGMMAGLYDHRAASVERSPTASTRLSRPRPTTLAEHRDPAFAPAPAAWVEERHVPATRRNWLIAFSSITAPTNERTFVPYLLPRVAVGNSAPVIDVDAPAAPAVALVANLGSFVLDYVARQKLGGTNLNYFYVNQLPVLGPAALEPHLGFVVPRVLELAYTAYDMAPLARDLGDGRPPYRWDPDRRAVLRAELDALFFRLYGVSRAGVEHIMATFPITRRKDVAAHGSYRTLELIRAAFDSDGASALDPPAGLGARVS